MLKDFYNVTYEYLLDEECKNKTTELLDIGKTLKLSDDAIQNIMELQKSNLKIFVILLIIKKLIQKM